MPPQPPYVAPTHAPSSYVSGRVYGCIFDDLHGLRSRDVVGVDTLLFETDYPHANGTWPNSRAVAHRLCAGAEMNAEECEKFPDDRHMKACAEECRKCAKECRDMVKNLAAR